MIWWKIVYETDSFQFSSLLSKSLLQQVSMLKAKGLAELLCAKTLRSKEACVTSKMFRKWEIFFLNFYEISLKLSIIELSHMTVSEARYLIETWHWFWDCNECHWNSFVPNKRGEIPPETSERGTVNGRWCWILAARISACYKV